MAGNGSDGTDDAPIIVLRGVHKWYGQFHVLHPGDDHHFHLGMVSLHVLQHFFARHPGHVHVQEQKVESPRIDRVERFRAVGESLDLEALRLEQHHQKIVQDGLVVVDDQDTVHEALLATGRM